MAAALSLDLLHSDLCHFFGLTATSFYAMVLSYSTGYALEVESYKSLPTNHSPSPIDLLRYNHNVMAGNGYCYLDINFQ